MRVRKLKKVFNIRNVISELFIIIGALIAAFSVACILLPNDAIDYGTAGIAIIISKLTGMDLSLAVFVVFLPFLFVGLFALGREFLIKAVIGSAAYMLGLDIFEKMPFVLNTEHFIAVIFGGAILGAGLSLILRAGGCIDGSEILAAMIVSKISEIKGISISMTGILITFNACVYTAAFLLINRNSALLSLLVYIVATAVIDHFTDRFQAIKQVTIITKNPEPIIKWIKEDMKKTCTVMNSSGAVAGDNKTLICYVTYFELQKFREAINASCDGAFITVSSIDEIIVNVKKNQESKTAN
ncbi:MAG: YitT family protein [Lachnospiraceae bacterium]|nr:YitT family protein [Lachnospiraceae bacterium]